MNREPIVRTWRIDDYKKKQDENLRWAFSTKYEYYLPVIGIYAYRRQQGSRSRPKYLTGLEESSHDWMWVSLVNSSYQFTTGGWKHT